MSFTDEVNKKFSCTLYGNYNREIDKVTGPAIRVSMNSQVKENISEKKQEIEDNEISL